MSEKINYSAEYCNYLNVFEQYAEKSFEKVVCDSNLTEAMKYSFFVGGKRLRPVLALASATRLGGDVGKILPYALALECLHTYSLVHDDLPALDNDDLRRGKKTCHAKYDEATAILAGDGLLNFAFESLLANAENGRDITAMRFIADYSGYDGMLGGQKADIEHEKSKNGDIDTLNSIYDKKTGKFLTLPFLIPTVLFAPEKESAAIECGGLLGRIFQYSDDLLDVLAESEDIGKTAGKDEKSHKLTSVKLLGVDGVRAEINDMKKRLYAKCKGVIDENFLKDFLERFTQAVL